jgi:hypothetical protein
MLNIRFPYEFDDAYAKKYGGRRAMYPSYLPPTIQITYPMSDNEFRATQQRYHAELMAAERQKVVNTIISKDNFQHRYPCFPTVIPNRLPNKHIISGIRPSLDAVSQPSFGNVGNLATFGGLTGGVLKNREYAKFILNRRANDVRRNADPAFAPPAEVITAQEQLKLDFSSLLGEVGDAISAGAYGDTVYGATRKLVGAFIRTMPLIEDPEDVAEIKRTVDNILKSAEVADDPEENRNTQGAIREALDKQKTARRARITSVLEKLERFLDEYMNVFRQRTLTERERIMASKSIAKSVGLFSFADFTSSLGIRRVEPEPPAEEAMPPLAPAGDDGGDDDDDGGGDGGPLGRPPAGYYEQFPEQRPELSLPSTQPEEGEAPPAPSARSAPTAAAAAAAPDHDYWVVEKKGQKIRIPAKESVLQRMSQGRLYELANALKRPNKQIYASARPATLMNYIRQRVVGDFSSLGVSIFDDVD